MNRHPVPCTVLALATTLVLLGGRPLAAQSTTASSASTPEPDETVVLSPFQVSTTKDKGYKATNSTSGTRLNTPIKELPLNLEVITADFIRDTGATNLREALRYSAGVVLDSQADAFVEVDADPQGAGANDPRGATRRVGDSTTKLRGFVIDQVLRDGFRRQYSADAINIDRVEVLRGPSALLYGVGSFGGVINYLPKRPQLKEHTYAGVTVGNYGMLRGEFDFTGPMGNSSWKPAFRIMGAYQENGDYTDFYNSKHLVVDPVFSFHPFPNTTVVSDNEFGYTHQTGVGFQNMRSNVNAAVSRTAGWLTDISQGMINTRTFRWSGPDTYLKGPFRNNVLDVTQKITDDLFFRAGVAESRAVFDSRQIQDTGTSATPFSNTVPANYSPTATIGIGGTSYNLRDALTQANSSGTFQGLTPFQIYQNRPPGSFRGDTLYGRVVNDSVENQIIPGPPATSDTAAIRYDWITDNRTELRDQVRADVNYRLDLGKWGTHNFVGGVQYMKLDLKENRFGPAYSYANHAVADIDRYSYKNPTDYSYFRFGTQGDGRPDSPQLLLNHYKNQTWDLGYYGVYQGKFFRDRLTLIGGWRWDRNDQLNTTYYDYEVGRAPTVSAKVGTKAPSATSPQLGVSFAISRNLTAFALYSTGEVPNYSATDGNGVPFPPTKAKNYEAGLKFDLLDGRISGTVSAYKIKRTNTPKYLWWAPSPYTSIQNGYDPAKPTATLWGYPNPEAVWYGIQKVGLATAKKIFPSGYWSTLDAMAAVGAGSNQYTPAAAFYDIPGVKRWWDWSIDPTTGMRGIQGQSEANTNAGTKADGLYFPLVNFSDPQEAAFAVAAKNDYNGWGGNFWYTPGQTYYYGDGTAGTGNAATGSGASVPLNDEAKGWDVMLIASITNDLQMTFNYAHLNRKITSSTYKFVKAPYWPFGWWYVKDGYFGTLGYARPVSEAYGDVTDTSTYKAPIPEYAQSADDSPANTASVWAKYSFDHQIPTLKGLSVGVGGYWEDRRQWFTGFSGGGGNITQVFPDGTSNAPQLVQLWTRSRLTVNSFIEYRTAIGRYQTRYALNVDNVLDDQHRYGQIYAPGRSIRFTVGVDF